MKQKLKTALLKVIKLETISLSNRVSLINPAYFEMYSEFREYLKGKFFLYSEIHPKENQIFKIKSKQYSVSDIIDVQVVGTVINPKKSLRAILTCYNRHEFLISDYDGCLFVYNGFKASEEHIKICDSAVLLKFRVYKLKKVKGE